MALGRCLIREPAVTLLDEPIAHLDAKLRHRMYAELKRIQHDRGTTTIYATPAQTEAMAMADRIVVIFGGKVQQIGSPRDLYERPVSVDVARFGGDQTMNVLPANLVSTNGHMAFDLAGHLVPLDDCTRDALVDSGVGQEVLIGVRPPDVACDLQEAPHSIPASVYAVEHSGHTPHRDGAIWRAPGRIDLRMPVHRAGGHAALADLRALPHVCLRRCHVKAGGHGEHGGALSHGSPADRFQVPEELVIVRMEAATAAEVIERLGSVMVEHGYIRPSFIPAAIVAGGDVAHRAANTRVGHGNPARGPRAHA